LRTTRGRDASPSDFGATNPDAGLNDPQVAGEGELEGWPEGVAAEGSDGRDIDARERRRRLTPGRDAGVAVGSRLRGQRAERAASRSMLPKVNVQSTFVIPAASRACSITATHSSGVPASTRASLTAFSMLRPSATFRSSGRGAPDVARDCKLMICFA